MDQTPIVDLDDRFVQVARRRARALVMNEAAKILPRRRCRAMKETSACDAYALVLGAVAGVFQHVHSQTAVADSSRDQVFGQLADSLLAQHHPENRAFGTSITSLCTELVEAALLGPPTSRQHTRDLTKNLIREMYTFSDGGDPARIAVGVANEIPRLADRNRATLILDHAIPATAGPSSSKPIVTDSTTQPESIPHTLRTSAPQDPLVQHRPAETREVSASRPAVHRKPTSSPEPWGVGMTVVFVLAIAEGLYAGIKLSYLDGALGGAIVFVIGSLVVRGYRLIRRRRARPGPYEVKSSSEVRLKTEMPSSGVEPTLQRYAALRELAALHKDGILSDDEFAAEKRMILTTRTRAAESDESSAVSERDRDERRRVAREQKRIAQEQVATEETNRIRGR